MLRTCVPWYYAELTANEANTAGAITNDAVSVLAVFTRIHNDVLTVCTRSTDGVQRLAGNVLAVCNRLSYHGTVVGHCPYHGARWGMSILYRLIRRPAV